MEVCEMKQAFEEEDGDLRFSHTKIICKERDQYFYAITNLRYRSESDVDPAGLKTIPIPASQIWPPFPKDFTRAPDPLPQNCYIKRPALIHYDDTRGSADMSSLLANEARVCEILRKSPHPNIAKYYGCIVYNSRIMGLCFANYGMNLLEMVNNDSRPVSTDFLMSQICSGVSHLHSLGLVHCDINPMNVVMDKGTPIIVDFDSCQKEGESFGIKGGTRGWTDEQFTVARREIDYYGISMIRAFLEGR
jgi:serine/threonine protein kinase